MAYRVIISPRAQKEIEEAIDYYSQNSNDAPKDFIINLENAYRTLEKFPFFKIRYKSIRALKIRKFPYSLYYVIVEDRKIVRVLSCFHHKLNPGKRPE